MVAGYYYTCRGWLAPRRTFSPLGRTTRRRSLATLLPPTRRWATTFFFGGAESTRSRRDGGVYLSSSSLSLCRVLQRPWWWSLFSLVVADAGDRAWLSCLAEQAAYRRP